MSSAVVANDSAVVGNDVVVPAVVGSDVVVPAVMGSDVVGPKVDGAAVVALLPVVVSTVVEPTRGCSVLTMSISRIPFRVSFTIEEPTFLNKSGMLSG